MKRLISGEFKKLTTTRSTYLLFAGVVALALVTVLDPGHSAATFEEPFREQNFVFFTALLTRILIFVLGVRAITDEFRHGTIVPTLLVAPRRGRVVAAKAVVVASFGALLALVAWSAMTTAASFVAASDGTNLELDADAWRSLRGMVLGGAVWALVGLGLGTLIRSPLVATVMGLAWMMGLEDALGSRLGDAAGYLPGEAGVYLATGSSDHAGIAALTMLAYGLAMFVVAWFAIRRDVTH